MFELGIGELFQFLIFHWPHSWVLEIAAQVRRKNKGTDLKFIFSLVLTVQCMTEFFCYKMILLRMSLQHSSCWLRSGQMWTLRLARRIDLDGLWSDLCQKVRTRGHNDWQTLRLVSWKMEDMLQRGFHPWITDFYWLWVRAQNPERWIWFLQ